MRSDFSLNIGAASVCSSARSVQNVFRPFPFSFFVPILLGKSSRESVS